MLGGDSLTGVTTVPNMTYMTKTQIYFTEEDLKALGALSQRLGRSVADLVREAVRHVWLRPEGHGPVSLWDGPIRASSADHDSVYDDPGRPSGGEWPTRPGEPVALDAREP